MICEGEIAVALRPAGTEGAVVSAVGVVVKFAVTVVAEPNETGHVPVPEHPPPLQPPNAEPEAGVAVSVIDVPELKEPEHVPLGQLIPEGELVIVPEPLPECETVSV